ncbi:DUF2167 domain-containing protein [Longimicrobium sp.]|uniref:DUF2167 domain-containing protein n=1 Tax=Longimicrobium sp. TaxID=2029185 RepID=UPI002C510F13|nr:DUF2167 domain-containing protein [Longimicrobium sp.]HSU17835.1 DUF2167 domain-containing protein [Longimicrobium sp.]
MRRSIVLLTAVLVPAALHGQAPPQPAAQDSFTPAEFDATLHYQTGTISLPGGIATIRLPEGYRFLDGENAERVIVQGWGNPPGTSHPLGMIVPARSPVDSAGWGVVVTYRDDGYVKDDEAEKIDYDEMLRQMQQETREDNAERARQGYATLDLVGWAARPRYDVATHKLYWARELAEVGAADGEHALNYDVRVLGRRGVLSLNAVAGMSQLPEIERDMQGVLGFVDFNEGHRYADFTGGDKVAAYGIGALVAGTVAAKAGFFKVLLLGLLAAKKAIVAGVIALAAAAKRLFGGGSSKEGGKPAAG